MQKNIIHHSGSEEKPSTSMNTLKEQESRIALLERENFNLKMETAKLRTTLDRITLPKGMRELEGEIQKLREEKHDVDQALIQANSALESLFQAQQAMAAQHSLAMETIKNESAIEAGTLRQDLQQLSAINAELKTKIEDLQHEKEIFVREQEAFQREQEKIHALALEEKQKKSEQLGMANVELLRKEAGFKEQIEQLKNINGELEEQMEQLKERNAVLKEEMTELTEKNGELKEEMTELTEKNAELKEEIAELTEKNGELNDHIGELKKEIAELTQKNAQFTQDIGQLKAQIEELTQRNQTLEQTNTKLTHSTNAIDQRNTENSNLLRIIEELKTQNVQLTKTIEQFKAQNMDLTVKFQESADTQKNSQSHLNATQATPQIQNSSNNLLLLQKQQAKLELALDAAAKFKAKLVHHFPQAANCLVEDPLQADQEQEAFIRELLSASKALTCYFEEALLRAYSQIPSAPRIIRMNGSFQLLEHATLSQCKSYLESVLQDTASALKFAFQELQNSKDEHVQLHAESERRNAELNAKLQFYAAKIQKYRGILHKKEHFIEKALEQLEILSCSIGAVGTEGENSQRHQQQVSCLVPL